MDFLNAVKKMKEGKKVRRTCWRSGSYYLWGNSIRILNMNNNCADIEFNEIEATDWEVIERKCEKCGKNIDGYKIGTTLCIYCNDDFEEKKTPKIIAYGRAVIPTFSDNILWVRFDLVNKTIKKFLESFPMECVTQSFAKKRAEECFGKELIK